jgi:peptidoglycan/LPS O-acetylase OafA/YrhL
MIFNKIKSLIFPKIIINYQDSRININELDGVRGLAITMVILFHCFRFPFGWSGVDLFFVLSGFLITGILLDSKNNINYFKNFWAKRILRIFPLYYLILIIILLPKKIFNINLIGEPSLTYWFYIHNWKFTFDGSFPTGKGTLNHFWSLAIEEQFYLIFPIIIKFARPKTLIRIIFLFILSSITLRCILWYNNNIGYYVLTFSRIDALSIGALLAYLIRNKRDLLLKWTNHFFYLSLAIIIIILFNGNFHFSNKYFATFGYTVLALFYSTLIIYSISSFRYNFFQILFNNKILRFLGKIAYGLYVYHYIFYILLKPLIENQIFRILNNAFYSKLFVSISIVFLTLVVSYISYNYFEKRFLVLKKKFA